MYDYIHDGAEIYRQSFATIRSEARLDGLDPETEKVVVRMIHACGQVDLLPDVRIAADESIRKADDPMRVVELEAADLAIVKVAPLGGVRAALHIAEETGLPMVVSSALDSSPGMAAGVALAAALPELGHACGLGTINLLDGDVIADPLVPRDGTIDVARAAAARHLDPTCVERRRASPERREWWRERLIASYQHLKRDA